MPDWSRNVAHALAALGLRPEREREIADELAAHLEDRYCEVRGRGVADADARRIALSELSTVLVPELRRVESPWADRVPLGNPQRTRFFETLTSDICYGVRGLRTSRWSAS